MYTEVFERKYKSQRKVQGGEHETLLLDSNLSFSVHSSLPLLYGAGPCERKEGLDTFFLHCRQAHKVSIRLSLVCSKEETEAYTGKWPSEEDT